MTPQPTATYRLPDGRLIEVADDLCKGEPEIGFTLADGSIVQAERVADSPSWWCCSADYPNHDPGCRNASHLPAIDLDALKGDPNLDFLVAGLIDDAPGPGAVRPWEHPELPEVRRLAGLLAYHVPDDIGGWRMFPALPPVRGAS